MFCCFIFHSFGNGVHVHGTEKNTSNNNQKIQFDHKQDHNTQTHVINCI